MIWTATYLLWVLLQENDYQHMVYTIGLIGYCSIATYVTSQSKGTTQFYLFQSS